MPLVFHRPLFPEANPTGELGVWRIDETEEALREMLELHPAEDHQLQKIKGEGRRREFLAARELLHQMSGRPYRGALIKDDYGKPHLQDSDHHVSISHSQDLSAAVAHLRPCGIDVQLFVNRIHRLAPRFMGPREQVFLTDANRLIFQHLVWGAKEAMYKAYGRREIDFREHLLVDLAGVPLEAGRTKGFLEKGSLRMIFDLDYRIINGNYMLVSAVATE